MLAYETGVWRDRTLPAIAENCHARSRWVVRRLSPDEFVFIESTPESWLKVLDVSLGKLWWPLLLFLDEDEEVGEMEARPSGTPQDEDDGSMEQSAAR